MPAEVESMAYVIDRGLPWHREGNGVERLQTAAEMIVASGLDWEVAQAPITTTFDGAFVAIPDKVANVRQSDGSVLGVVGRQYQVIQNRDAFTFADSLVDSGEAKYETAGSLRGGRVTFLSMELDHLDLRLAGDDDNDNSIKTYLLLSNAHDGSRALEADITKVRVVCANTLNIAIKGARRRFKVRHSGSTEGKLLAAREALGIAFNYDKAFEEAAERLLNKRLVDEQVLEIFQKYVWPIDLEMASEGRLETHPATLAFEDYMKSENLDPIRGTAWGALNAVAEFVDHEVEYRGRFDTAEDVRTNSILWGTGQAKKQAAFEALMKVK